MTQQSARRRAGGTIGRLIAAGVLVAMSSVFVAQANDTEPTHYEVEQADTWQSIAVAPRRHGRCAPGGQQRLRGDPGHGAPAHRLDHPHPDRLGARLDDDEHDDHHDPVDADADRPPVGSTTSTDAATTTTGPAPPPRRRCR